MPPAGFELAFTLPPELVSFYGSVGTDIPVLNGNGLWVLPVPATYVIDEEGRIRFAHIEEDIRKRAEPADVLRVIEGMVRGRALSGGRQLTPAAAHATKPAK